jgi:hypothetical protein
MIKRLERLKNTVNKYMADLRPDRLMTYQSERKLVVSQRPGVYTGCPRRNVPDFGRVFLMVKYTI